MRIVRFLMIGAVSFSLSACSMGDRLAQIGEAPQPTKIVNPTTQKGYQPVSLPMPAPKNVTPQQNSRLFLRISVRVMLVTLLQWS